MSGAASGSLGHSSSVDGRKDARTQGGERWSETPPRHSLSPAPYFASLRRCVVASLPRPCVFPPMIALARKYRPRRFADLLVQDHVAAALRGAVARGRVGHGYLLAGPRGTGKTTDRKST